MKIFYCTLTFLFLVLVSCSPEETSGKEELPLPEAGRVRLYLPASIVLMPATRAAATEEENALSRLDIYIFDDQDVLEQVIPEATIEETAGSNWVEFDAGSGMKSFYLVANARMLSALNVTPGETSLAQFRELATDEMDQLMTPPLLMSGYRENVDVTADNVISIDLSHRVAKLEISNEPLRSGLTISTAKLSGGSASVHLFDHATGSLTAAAVDLTFAYEADKAYYVPATGNMNVTLSGVWTGSETTYELNFTAGRMAPNALSRLRVPDFGTTETISSLDVSVPAKTIASPGTDDYSGITWLGGDQYAIITDKKDGFYTATIELSASGVTTFTRSEFIQSSATSRDCEGIVYHPGRGTLFISGEKDQEILEYRLDGTKTGNKLAVPGMFSSTQITSNYGFEALGYDETTGRFWTTTEASLPIDGGAVTTSSTRKFNLHRIQAFDEDLQPAGQYVYKSENRTANGSYSQYAFGIPAITALPDGKLLVMEREFYVSTGFLYVGSFVDVNIFLVDPTDAVDVTLVSDLTSIESEDSQFLTKIPLGNINTGLLSGISNYEGMCLGPVLADGTRSMLLINDSQEGYGKFLGEYLKLLKLSYNPAY